MLLLPYISSAQNVSLSGFVREKGSKESLPYANITIQDGQGGTYSNAYGFYTLQIPANRQVHIVFSSIGYESTIQTLTLKTDSILVVELIPKEHQLEEIIVVAPQNPVKPIGNIHLPTQIVKEVPSLMGEKDVIKTIKLLPGVQRGTEGSTALYVRGGGPGQNLILLDDAQVYNANHLFGFFSVFNGDAIKNVSFWKGSIPARYGGRISSVIDVQMKDGNKEEVKGEAGVGLLSARLMVEGPLKKGKSSFLIATRRSYLDLLTMPLMPEDAKVGYRFYDFNVKLNFDHNAKNRFFISGYFGNDKLMTKEKVARAQSNIDAETNLGWGNSTASVRWNHIFNDRLFSNTTFVYSRYNFYLNDSFVRVGVQPYDTFSDYNSSISDYSIKTDFDYFLSNKHHLKSGFIFTYHLYKPRDVSRSNGSERVNEEKEQRFPNQELGAYIEDTWQPSEKLTANVGIRFNGVLTASKNYFVAEPRVSLSYEVYNDISLSASYARTNQFVHLLSNTGIGLATDLWVPVTFKAPPQQADQVAVGFSKEFLKHGFSLSVESYRKYMRNILAYKEGATFLGIDDGVSDVNWEDNITLGEGFSYGTEVLLQKTQGRLKGWVGYTLSWTVHKFKDLNYGKNFYPKYDSRHNISLVGIYKISPKIALSASWVYSTGNALSIPQGYFFGDFATGAYTRLARIPGTDSYVNEIEKERIDKVPYYGSRNSFRAEAYHRLDIAIQLHKKKRKYQRYWEFGLFNAYNRKNPFYYYLETTNDYVSNGQRIELKKKSLFPILPSISYNIKF